MNGSAKKPTRYAQLVNVLCGRPRLGAWKAAHKNANLVHVDPWLPAIPHEQVPHARRVLPELFPWSCLNLYKRLNSANTLYSAYYIVQEWVSAKLVRITKDAKY